MWEGSAEMKVWFGNVGWIDYRVSVKGGWKVVVEGVDEWHRHHWHHHHHDVHHHHNVHHHHHQQHLPLSPILRPLNPLIRHLIPLQRSSGI